jgi:AraC family cel operon transcriptional repressor
MNEIRLTYAANLPVHSDIKIIGIASEAGFQSLSHFHHIFKREFGLTPHKFRSGSFKKTG